MVIGELTDTGLKTSFTPPAMSPPTMPSLYIRVSGLKAMFNGAGADLTKGTAATKSSTTHFILNMSEIIPGETFSTTF